MFEIIESDDRVIEVKHTGIFTVKAWKEYQELLLKLLDESDQKLYILSNFTQTATFDKEIVREVGTAKHLTHPNLGLIVLLGGSALQNFVLVLTEHRALSQQAGARLRIHTDYDRALEMLVHQRDIEATV